MGKELSAEGISAQLRKMGDEEIARHSTRFFKTGKGQYGEGDRFLGIRVPRLREVAKKSRTLPLQQARRLLHSAYHEERLCALLILVEKFSRGDEELQRSIYELYLQETAYINNSLMPIFPLSPATMIFLIPL